MLINVTSEEDLKARGLANRLDDLDMIISPHDGALVPVAIKDGVHVCWGCCEQFDPEDRALRLVEMRPPGSTVRVGVHSRCVDPKKRKIFSDMGGDRQLQSVKEVEKGLQLRRMVAKAVKPFIDAAQASVAKIIT